MDISQEKHQILKGYVDDFYRNISYELESKMEGSCTKDMFVKIVQYCKSVISDEAEESSLDISININNQTYRVSVIGKEAIHAYCKSHAIDKKNIRVIKKNRVNGKLPLHFEDMNFKINLKEEQLLEDHEMNHVISILQDAPKHFRLKKRFSFITKNELFRYDCTLVKQSMLSATTFEMSRLPSSQEHYEVEIEFLRNGRNADEQSKMIIQSMCDLHVLLFGNTQRDNKVLLEYLKLCSFNISPQEALKKPGDYFFGPQPITLEQKNLIPADFGLITIQDHYTVTDKADGERTLLFIDGHGHGHFINNLLEIKKSKSNFKIRSALFDGEFIKKDKVGNDLNLYAIFDIYFDDKRKPVSALPLIKKDVALSSRHEHMLNFIQQHKTQKNIILKEFMYSMDDSLSIFDMSKLLYNKTSFGAPYHIDGLIFTPMYLGVGANYEGDVPSNMGTWANVFKWKPPEENTIDFLVRYEKDANGEILQSFEDGKSYTKIGLYVGLNPMKLKNFTAIDYFDEKISRPKNMYIASRFLPPGETNNDISTYVGDLKCGEDIIEDESIVEFSYNAKKWVPLRVRHAKTRGYRMNGLSRTANDYFTASNIWRSIQNPVSLANICGDETLNATDVRQRDNVYYSRSIARHKMASKNMMNFHLSVKEYLFTSFENSSEMILMDLACGKAGDLQRWGKGKFKKVVGIDHMRDNIENPIEGAYARTFNEFERSRDFNNRFNYLYLTMDCSQVLDSNYISTMESETDKSIANLLWGNSNKIAMKRHRIEPFFKIASSVKFDIVSCQFAIHYFFKSENTIDNFISNVDYFLKDGGYFIGTCLNGFKVKEKLEHLLINEEVRGMVDNRILWNIKRLYKNSNPKKIKIGETIQIFMESIGQRFEEYLVDINLLKTKFSTKGIELVEVKQFDEFKSNINLNDKEKEYSFLNMAFKFQKRLGTPLSNPPMKEQVVPSPIKPETLTVPAPVIPGKLKIVLKDPLRPLKWASNSCYIDSAIMAIFHYKPNQWIAKQFLQNKLGKNEFTDDVKNIRTQLKTIYNSIHKVNDEESDNTCTNLRQSFKKFDDHYRAKINKETRQRTGNSPVDANVINWVDEQLEPSDVYTLLNRAFIPETCIVMNQIQVDWNSAMIYLSNNNNSDKLLFKNYIPKFTDQSTNGQNLVQEIQQVDKVMYVTVMRGKQDGRATKVKASLTIEEFLRIGNTSLQCVSIIIHHGNSVNAGHYTCMFKHYKKNNWQHYDDMGDGFTEIGSFEDVMMWNNEFVKYNSVGIFYVE